VKGGVVTLGNGKTSAVIGGGSGTGLGDFLWQESRRSSKSLIENPAGKRGAKRSRDINMKNSRMMIVSNVSLFWAVLGLLSLSALMAVLALIGQTVPLDVANEVTPVTLFCRVYGTWLVR
jgi:hypothetical protein